jgi:hypothetical protein
MCERNLGSTLSTFAINRQVGCHERLVRTAYMVCRYSWIFINVLSLYCMIFLVYQIHILTISATLMHA